MSAVYQWTGQQPAGAHSGSMPCSDCGLPHAPERRRAILRRMLPCTRTEVHEAWPHMWPTDDSGQRALRRDLDAMGATRDASGLWSLS